MVALYNVEDEYGQNPKTLGDWVKNFRLKKIQMKRKLRTSGGQLRVCAILSTALMTAELELRRKQQERFQKWLEFQSKINKNHELQADSNTNNKIQHEKMVLVSSDESDAQSYKQNEQITNLWKCELSELDNFMRSISSANSCRQESDSGGGDCPLLTSPQHHHQSIQVSS